MTGHHELDHTIGAATLTGPVTGQPQEPRLSVTEGAERLADDDRLGAAPADPALDAAVRMDDPARPGPGGRRTTDRDDRGDRERLPGRLELGCASERGRQLTPFSWRMVQTFWGVSGISMWRTPRCHKASTTALAIAGGAPTVADSPTPFAPSG